MAGDVGERSETEAMARVLTSVSGFVTSATPADEALSALARQCPGAAEWNAVLGALPLEPASFAVYAKVRRPEFVDGLGTWLNAHRKTPVDEAARAARGHLAVLYITLATMQGASAEAGASTAHRGVCADRCRAFFGLDEVRAAVRALYRPDSGLDGQPAPSSEVREEWDSIDWDAVELVNHGSTSMIVKSVSGRQHGETRSLALKLLLLPYATVSLIATETERYSSVHNAADGRGARIPNMVRVWASSRRWILMDHVEGRTFADEVRRLLAVREGETSRAPGNLRLDVIRALSLPLLHGMAQLRSRKKVHEDLSPSNIMVSGTGEPGAPYEITFIDFGRNYLYTRAIGGLEAPEGGFIAPEVRDNADPDDGAAWRSDLYSIGKILVLLGDVGDVSDGVIPDRFYGQGPLVARVIEDLIDGDPRRRLLVFGGRDVGDNPYEGLAALLTQELDATQGALVHYSEDREQAVPDDRDSVLAALTRLLPLSKEPKKRYRIYRIRRRQRILDDPRGSFYARWLLRFTVVASVTYYVTAGVCVLWFFRDIGIDILGPFGQLGLRAFGLREDAIPLVDDLRVDSYRLGDVSANLPARIVGLSFALIGSRYYQNILSSFTTRPADSARLSGRFFRTSTEAVCRLMSFWSLPLILACNLVDTRWWPIASAVGYTGVLCANLTSSRFADQYIARSRRAGLTTVPGRHQKITGLDGYRVWGPSMAFYVILCWVIGLLLSTGILRDVYVYAISVAAVNIGLFYIVKTGANALDIRTGLARAVLAAERLRCIHEPAESSRMTPPAPQRAPVVRAQ